MQTIEKKISVSQSNYDYMAALRKGSIEPIEKLKNIVSEMINWGITFRIAAADVVSNEF